jgi:6-phosphofructokinase 1
VNSVRCCIPEHPFDLEKLIDLLVKEKYQNPSRYSLIVLSEGATWVGHKVQEYGEPDAYGQRKKMNIAEAFSDEIKRATGEETIVSDLTYDLRSGSPDFLDKMIAYTFATMALECIADGGHGRMMAIRNGCFVDADIPDPKLGARKVDLTTMYNTDRYRPDYSRKKGLPIFLTRA